MSNIDEYLGQMTVVFVLATTLQVYLFRRRINNIADPLLFFAISSAFSLGLGIYAVDSIALYARIVSYFCLFYIGFFAAIGKPRDAVQPLVIQLGIGQFKRVIVISCILIFLANLAVWTEKGIIMLSENPSLLKSTAYAGGFGFVRRINWGLGVFALIAAMYWYLWERSKTALFWLGFGILTNITTGAKSALLPIIFALGIYWLNPFRPYSLGLKMPNRRIILYFGLIAIVPVGVVLLIEQGSLKAALHAMVVRLFFFGDILLYWGQPELRAHFCNLGVLDYLRDSLGSILGALRLTDYTAPVGNQFVRFTLPAGNDFPESLGPNLPFYVRGELYFGPWFAAVHALVVGLVFGCIRRKFISYRGANLLHYTIAALAVCLSVALPVEEGLAISQAFDFLCAYLFVYIFALIIGVAAKPKALMQLKKDIDLLC